MPSKSLTILFTPLDGWGHINACHGLAQVLKNRGHRVIFAIDIAFKDKLTKYGFEEKIHSLPNNASDPEFWAKKAAERVAALRLSPIEIVEKFVLIGFTTMYLQLKDRDSQYEQIIREVKPDLIVIDSYVCSPTLCYSGIPWIRLYSAAPLMLFNNEELPPAHSGLPSNGDKNEWKIFQNQFNEITSKIQKDINEWCASKGAPLLSGNLYHPNSEHLNIYLYPEELDYHDIQTLPKNFVRIDSSVRESDEVFKLPENLVSKPGKLVFLSLGSFGGVDLPLMKRLAQVMGRSQHRFIVSKGPLHDQFELPDNMWGQRMVPQLQILPIVDLVITHGGNNSVTESMYFGKPMIVMPLFADQFDNAQRIQEKGFGIRVNPFSFDDDLLLREIDRLVSDENLKIKLKTASERMRNCNSIDKCCEMIENIKLK